MTALVALVFEILLLPSAQAETLDLAGYLAQVNAQNPGLQAAQLQSEGAFARSGEGNTLTAPSFFANAQWIDDKTYSFVYDSARNNLYSFGIQYQAPFGLQSKLTYAFNNYNLNNIDIGTTRINAAYWDVSPKIELLLPLWGGGFGRATRANRDAANAAALGAHYGARASATQQLIEAEIAYWQLAGLQQTLGLQKETLARAEKLYGWSRRRAGQNLSDRSDAYQAEANLTLRRLELESLQSDLTTAIRNFNALRGDPSDTLAETLLPLSDGLNAPFKLPPDPQAAARDDVRAAEQQIVAAEASSQLGAEKNRPTLNLFGSYALNGRDVTAKEANSDVYEAHRPTRVVGVNLSVPLNLGTTSDALRGYQLEKSAAEKNLAKKLIDQKTNYLTLKQRLTDLDRKVELARQLEKIQKIKADNERNRVNLGRTTTFQALTFEQDFSTAELTRVRMELDLLATRAQFKAFDSPTSKDIAP